MPILTIKSHRRPTPMSQPRLPAGRLHIMSQPPFGPTFEPEPIPSVLAFRLPDDTQVRSSQVTADGSISIELGEEPLCSFLPQLRALQISPHGIVTSQHRTEFAPILRLILAQNRTTISHDDLWSALYGLWLRKAENDVMPFEFSDDIENAAELKNYLGSLSDEPISLEKFDTHPPSPHLSVSTGLAFAPPDARGPLELLLVRASFWQGAGASFSKHWLRSPIAHPSLSPLCPFPFFESFTRGEHVLTTHPKRPPKPAPGSVLYARFICAVGQMLKFTHIDASNPKHFEAYQRWQNSDRVNNGWRERGPEEKHRAYLAAGLADHHVMGFIIEWDGEVAGYGETTWVKEDPMG